MSYLEKILGVFEVEWKVLGEVVDLITTGRLNANVMEDNGIYPFFTCNEKQYKIKSYAFDLEAILISGNGSQVGHLNYYNGKFNAYQRTYIIGEFKDSIEVQYLYHYLNHTLRGYITKHSRKGSVPYITMPMLVNFPIPVPDIEIQKEIVRILDSFTELTAELTAALTARKKQYNYYREKLLSFEEGDVVWKTLGEIAEYSKERIGPEVIDENNYVGVDNLLQNRLGKTISTYVPKSGSSIKYNTNDILIGNIRPYLKKIWYADRFGGTNGDVLVIQTKSNNVNPRFLFQVLSDDRFFEYNMQHAKGAKMPRGNKVKIMEYKIPVPPLEEQERIVSILDKFDT